MIGGSFLKPCLLVHTSEGLASRSARRTPCMSSNCGNTIFNGTTDNILHIEGADTSSVVSRGHIIVSRGDVVLSGVILGLLCIRAPWAVIRGSVEWCGE